MGKILQKIYLAMLLLFASVHISAAEEQRQFGMLLLGGEGHLFASHLIQWEEKNNFQAFLEVKLADLKTHQTIVKKVENNQQIYTMLPEKLSKKDLKSGEEFDVKIDIFKGEFGNAGKRILASTDASMRSLFYRQIHKAKNDKKKKYSKFEKYYAIQSGKKTFLFNRVSDYRPFEHVVIANNQCEMKNQSLEVKMLKSKSQPTYSGSLESLKAIADKYDLDDLKTIYLNKKEKSW